MVGYVRQLGSPSIWVFLLIWYIFLSPVCAFETLGQECTLSISYSKTCFVGYFGCRGQIYLKSTSLLQFLQNLTRDQLCINPAKASHRVCQGWSYIPQVSSHVVGALKKKSMFCEIPNSTPSSTTWGENVYLWCLSKETTDWGERRQLFPTILNVSIFSWADLVQTLWK